jgi:molybdopterin-guanine dinucleotide biosynthesis protein A
MNGIVLAGGLSSRMGSDKASLPWGDSDLLHTVLQQLAPVCDTIVVVTNRPRDIQMPGVLAVADHYQQCGPLAGIQAGLQASGADYNFIVACDMPFLSSTAITYIGQAAIGYEAAVPFVDGYFHPLHAVYHRNCLPYIDRLLAEGNYRIIELYKHIRLVQISKYELVRFDEDLAMLNNVNTPAEYQLHAARLNRCSVLTKL